MPMLRLSMVTAFEQKESQLGRVGDMIAFSSSSGIGVTLGCKAPAEGGPESHPWSSSVFCQFLSSK